MDQDEETKRFNTNNTETTNLVVIKKALER